MKRLEKEARLERMVREDTNQGLVQLFSKQKNGKASYSAIHLYADKKRFWNILLLLFKINSNAHKVFFSSFDSCISLM